MVVPGAAPGCSQHQLLHRPTGSSTNSQCLLGCLCCMLWYLHCIQRDCLFARHESSKTPRQCAPCRQGCMLWQHSRLVSILPWRSSTGHRSLPSAFLQAWPAQGTGVSSCPCRGGWAANSCLGMVRVGRWWCKEADQPLAARTSEGWALPPALAEQ